MYYMGTPILQQPQEVDIEIDREVPAPPTPPRIFHLRIGSDTTAVRGRSGAVKRAKAISRQRHRPVHVERDDRQVRMTFWNGKLETYRFESRSRR